MSDTKILSSISFYLFRPYVFMMYEINHPFAVYSPFYRRQMFFTILYELYSSDHDHLTYYFWQQHQCFHRSTHKQHTVALMPLKGPPSPTV